MSIEKGKIIDMEKREREITVSDLDIMCRYAEELKVEVELTITPDERQLTVRPWEPITYSTHCGSTRKGEG